MIIRRCTRLNLFALTLVDLHDDLASELTCRPHGAPDERVLTKCIKLKQSMASSDNISAEQLKSVDPETVATYEQLKKKYHLALHAQAQVSAPSLDFAIMISKSGRDSSFSVFRMRVTGQCCL
jgi:hypothetical protein